MPITNPIQNPFVQLNILIKKKSYLLGTYEEKSFHAWTTTRDTTDSYPSADANSTAKVAETHAVLTSKLRLVPPPGNAPREQTDAADDYAPFPAGRGHFSARDSDRRWDWV